MKTSTKTVQLPGLGLNAYEVDGRAYVSMSEIVKATRNNDDTRPLIKWLSGAQNLCDANGSQPFECNVSRAQGGTSVANLFSPAVAEAAEVKGRIPLLF